VDIQRPTEVKTELVVALGASSLNAASLLSLQPVVTLLNATTINTATGQLFNMFFISFNVKMPLSLTPNKTCKHQHAHKKPLATNQPDNMITAYNSTGYYICNTACTLTCFLICILNSQTKANLWAKTVTGKAHWGKKCKRVYLPYRLKPKKSKVHFSSCCFW
jgi:hypothetical protein